MTQQLNVVQPCGVAKLMAAVGILELDAAYLACGLKLCPECEQPGVKADLYPYCSKKCQRAQRHRDAWTQLLCEECGVLFPRRTFDVIARLKRGQEHVFCGYKCVGKQVARLYGFKAGNPGGNPKKYCKRGHLLAETRTKWGQCRPCENLRQRRYYHAKKAAK